MEAYAYIGNYRAPSIQFELYMYLKVITFLYRKLVIKRLIWPSLGSRVNALQVLELDSRVLRC